MIELYSALSDANPNFCNIVLTVIDGQDFGDKCLLSAGALLWERNKDGFFSRHLSEIAAVTSTCHLEIEGQKIFAEVLGNEKKFVICGGGHISMPLIQLSLMMGCPVTVLEDRPVFAENARKAGATNVILAPFEEGLAGIEGDLDTFFIIVTRGHQFDKECLNAISRKPHAYIGMIGSRRRVTMVKESLIKDYGCDPDIIASVHTPIGLRIGAETPEEISIAIMAEVIQVKSESKRNSTYSRELMRAITGMDDAQMPKVLATIVGRKGSAPRNVGTKMLIYPDGRIVDTIGGGCVESDVIRTARMMMDEGTGKSRIIHVDMTEDDAADSGMVCGGTVDVLLETLEPGYRS